MGVLMIGILHYVVPGSIFAVVLILTRYLWSDNALDNASSWLKQVVPATIAALLGWLALRLGQRPLALHFLAGGPQENATAETASWNSVVYFDPRGRGMIAQ